MPCDSKPRTPEWQRRQREAMARLEKALSVGTIRVRVGPTGSIAFEGRTNEDRDDVADLCAYRKLQASGSIALRMAQARAEALSGRQVNPQAVAAGVHSHDGGKTWGSH